MSIEEKRKILLRFLKLYDCYVPFMRGMKTKYSPKTNFTTLIEQLNRTLEYNIDEVINYSFIWSKTDEGETYWSKIHLRWKDYINYYHYSYKYKYSKY